LDGSELLPGRNVLLVCAEELAKDDVGVDGLDCRLKTAEDDPGVVRCVEAVLGEFDLIGSIPWLLVVVGVVRPLELLGILKDDLGDWRCGDRGATSLFDRLCFAPGFNN